MLPYLLILSVEFKHSKEHSHEIMYKKCTQEHPFFLYSPAKLQNIFYICSEIKY